MPAKTFIFHLQKSPIVSDGDTCSVLLDLGFGIGQLSPTTIRMNGIDAPESSSHGVNKVEAREKACGIKVKKIVQGWFAKNPDAVLFSISWDGTGDKYGRILGDFGTVGSGPALAKFLLKNKLVRAYTGDKKLPWTDEQLKAVEDYKETP